MWSPWPICPSAPPAHNTSLCDIYLLTELAVQWYAVTLTLGLHSCRKLWLSHICQTPWKQPCHYGNISSAYPDRPAKWPVLSVHHGIQFVGQTKPLLFHRQPLSCLGPLLSWSNGAQAWHRAAFAHLLAALCTVTLGEPYFVIPGNSLGHIVVRELTKKRDRNALFQTYVLAIHKPLLHVLSQLLIRINIFFTHQCFFFI